MPDTFYQEWRSTMIERAGLSLDQPFCEARLAVLQDETLSETQTFIRNYGSSYHKQVIAWFQQALSEA